MPCWSGWSLPRPQVLCMQIVSTDGGVRFQEQANLDSPPPPVTPSIPFPCCPAPPHTAVLRFSSLGEGGMRSPSFVKLVEWLGLAEGSSGPGALCRAGSVEHRALPLDRGCCGGGPFSANSSLGALGCWADGDCSGCGDVGVTGVRGRDKGLDDDDSEEPRGTRGVRVGACWNLVRLVEWLGRGRL